VACWKVADIQKLGGSGPVGCAHAIGHERRSTHVTTRYRCTACGNLTRFDVQARRRTRAFHHYSIGGELHVEDEILLEEVIEDVSCRWCGNGAAVDAVEADDVVEAGETVDAAGSSEAT
jgi:hypothetical protein